MRAPTALLAGIALAVAAQVAHPQSPARLVDAIEAIERSGRIDINIVFGCGLRYLNHSPASEGDSLRLRFAPLSDCGDAGAALLGQQAPLDGARVVRSLEVERITDGEIDVTLRFAASERFVLAPTADSHGVRIRLLRPQSAGARIVVQESTVAPAGYAINLDSSQQSFDASAIAAATQATGNAAYVSEYRLADQTWYRLRIGPFESEAAARRILLTARARYPKAWLAIGDDEKLNATDTVPATPVAPTLPRASGTLTAQDIETTLRKARTALGRKDYNTAIAALTRLLEQPEFAKRAQAQELMGLARERNRQLAHAKAEYEEYLRRYPDGPAVKRVRERLHALRLATRAARTGADGGAEDRSWKLYGAAAQTYRRDASQLDNDAQSTDVTTLNALITDFDVVARRRGERFSVSSRASLGYIKDMLSAGPGDQTRVSSLFVELGDRERDWSARLGRQSRNSGGLFGTFDGLAASHQLKPRLRVDAAYGFPVENTREAPQSHRQFAGLSLDFGTFADAWDVALYGVTQQLDGSVDRQAFGTEVRYFRPGRTIVALLDYDVHFKELNNAVFLATFALPARWTVTANVDQRKSPSLSLRNALIGQPVATFDELLTLIPRSELEQLAVDRSADSRLYSLSVARPFGERWQWTLDYASFSTDGTPESGGVDAIAATGTDDSVSLQGIAASLFGGKDLSVIVLRHQTGASVDTDSVGLSTRLPLWRSWRIGPRLRVDQRHLHDDGSTQMLYVPTVRLDLQRSRMLLECEVGAEMGRRTLGEASENTTRFYFSLGYRLSF